MSIPAHSHWASKHRLLATGSVLVVAVLALLTWAPYFGLHRLPSQSESAFSYFAESLGEAALCEKISWEAFQRYSVLFGGGGASFARSDCYESVAVRNHDPAVCWQVRPLVDFNPVSPGYSALACRQRVRQGDRGYVTLAPEVVIRAFTTLGYDVDELHGEGVIEPAIRPSDVYRGLEREPQVVDRVEQALARPDAVLPAEAKDYLAHLAAVDTGDAHWCERIPVNQAVATEDIPFRDWCYFTVAFNTLDVRVCKRMTAAAAEAKVIKAKAAGVRPEIAEQFSMHAQCDRVDQRVGPRMHYGPEVPQDPAQTERLIAALGYPMPRARDWPPYQIAAYYARFLDALQARSPPDPRRDAARAKLIGRLTALDVIRDNLQKPHAP
jgi:hypothetical protein